ncbi:MAG: pyruvate kinase [Oscillospiraceae bacterium]|jgi:pyruvate kinase|nr:pyruvate kinase [Oscillospiraceae bacterium]
MLDHRRKTKIICTLGPSTDDETILKELMFSGMNVARFNFSHSTHEEHKKKLDLVVKLREEFNLPIATMLDTKGPEIRIGKVKQGKVELKKDQIFVLTTKNIVGDENSVSVSFKDLPKDVTPGSTILIDDGLIELTVENIIESEIYCRVKNSGMISNNKGVNVPNTDLSMPFISKKDREDIIFGIENGFDFIAASFTRTADDILEIRKLFDEHDCHTMNIIAKIENMQGVANIDDIIRVSDGIMVARGDMGVEIPLEDVPVIQKMIIKKVYNAGKQVITATQMLDSMMKNPRPTRAEATDVANAIYDGTSAIMLSGETAAGLYPIESLRTMARIAARAEADIDFEKRFKERVIPANTDVTNAISHATCTTAHDLRAAAIVTVTKSGGTARMISKYRPECPIIGCSTYPHICRQLNLSWGVIPLLIDEENKTDDLFEHAVDSSVKAGHINDGELVVITAGVPLGISGTTNLMKVHVAGHVLLSGTGITKNSSCSSLCVCKSNEQAFATFKDGDILVLPQSSNDLLPLIKKSSGMILEDGGQNSHGAIVGLSLDIPVIVGAQNATEILKSGAVVTLDAARGVVSCNNNCQIF